MHTHIHPGVAVQLTALHAADLRRDADAYRIARRARLDGRTVRSGALRDQVGWSLVQLGLRMVRRPACHPALSS